MATGTAVKLNPSEKPTENGGSEWKNAKQVECIAKVRDGSNSYREMLRAPMDGKLRYHVPTGAVEYTHKSGEIRIIPAGNLKYVVLS